MEFKDVRSAYVDAALTELGRTRVHDDLVYAGPRGKDDLLLAETASQDVFACVPAQLVVAVTTEQLIRAVIALTPKIHDFDYSRQVVNGKMSRHMSPTGS